MVGSELRAADAMTAKPLSVKEDDFATKVRSLFRKSGYRSLPVVDGENRLVGVITRGDILNLTSGKSNIQAKGIMSPPTIYTTPGEDLLQVAEKLIAADVGRAPVITSETDRELLGIVCTHDILKKLREKKLRHRKKRIGEIMTTQVVSCKSEDPITKVWDKMDDTGFSGIPVRRGKGVIGMITRKDIIKAGHARIEKENERGRGKARNPPAVERLMHTPVISVTPDCTIGEAIDLMLRFDIGRLPVVNEGLVGIIDREDVLKTYLEE